MAKPAKKKATENLDEMLNRIRMENEALKRLIEALRNLHHGHETTKNSINQ